MRKSPEAGSAGSCVCVCVCVCVVVMVEGWRYRLQLEKADHGTREGQLKSLDLRWFISWNLYKFRV